MGQLFKEDSIRKLVKEALAVVQAINHYCTQMDNTF